MAKSGKKKKKGPAVDDGRRIVATNRKARYEYEILETIQAGLVLQGTEVKSLRAGKCTLSESFAAPLGDELYLMNCHISVYDAGSYANHDPVRTRKLLLRRRELKRLLGRVSERGLTLIPMRVYFLNSWAKVDIALARGKRHYDKRETIKKRDMDRDAAQEMARRD